MHRTGVVAFLLLLALGIPWYWPADDRSTVAGVPSWVAMAVLCGLLAAVLTAYLLRRAWPDDEEGSDRDGG